MSVAAPVLERKLSTQTEDEIHNSRIGENYARLISGEGIGVRAQRTEAARREEPVAKPVNAASAVETPAQASAQAPAAQPVYNEEPYLIRNARADSPIFRADNAIYKRLFAQSEMAVDEDKEEEENEDLRPTPTTIQYKTTDSKKTVEEGVITNESAEKRFSLSKRDKIIIAVVISVIVALFALIIINSAIISGINNDLNSLQSSLSTVKAAYTGVSDEISSFTDNIAEHVREFAEQAGMIK